MKEERIVGRTEFEAYLTEKDDKFFLYLDKFEYTALFNSIGISSIFKIQIICESYGTLLIDEIIYIGVGEITELTDIFKLISDKSEKPELKIIINDAIEISFVWWADIFILADWDTIIKCIDGQKAFATSAEFEILDRLPEYKNIYFRLKNETLIVYRHMNLEEFNKLLLDSYFDKFEELLLRIYTDEEIEEMNIIDEEPIKLNLTEEERARLKSGLEIFTFMEAETADTQETVICPCRVVREKVVTDTENDYNETVEHYAEFPCLFEFGSEHYLEAHMLNDDFTKINKNELVKIKELYDKFKFPITSEGQNDENEFFDELSELYQSPTAEVTKELIAKYNKYYIPAFD